MEETLQHKTPPQCIGLSPASARNRHPDGSQADDALTINLDQSDVAAHIKHHHQTNDLGTGLKYLKSDSLLMLEGYESVLPALSQVLLTRSFFTKQKHKTA